MNAISLAALYDDDTTARQAADELMQMGIPETDISISRSEAGGYSSGRRATTEEHGFFATLKSMFGADDDASTYAEGVRRGGSLLTVTVDDAQVQQAEAVLEQFSPVDVDQRSAGWRQSGWTSFDERSSPYTADQIAAERSAALQGTTERAIPIVEEELQVGKREREGGRVRVRSYVVATPVSEAVSLRDQNVTIERRSVDRPLDATTGDAFREMTIEATERHEEAVVAKTARVKEELVVRQKVEEHTEQVSDTVRHTEVEVEDERTGSSRIARE